MTDGFAPRATALLDRLRAGGEDAAVAGELQALRDLWRVLSDAERVAAVPLATALAAAQAPAPRQASLLEDDAAARRALRGLDRIEPEGAFVCRYRGPRDPDALLRFFGLAEFRPGQREAVAAALAGRDSLVVMPTGGGKSLCYQLPGIAEDTLTVVVSPLIALMADQYRRLRAGGHPAAMIASGMEPGMAAAALDEVREGRARLVLCSPERFASATFLEALAARRVDLFAVDEAHCVSEWGHDFRPDYLRLRDVIVRLGRPAVMACTATATEAVGEEIAARLGLRDPYVLRAGFDRPNLSFDVIGVDGAGSRARKGMLAVRALAAAEDRPGIVYCGTRREVEEVTELLRGAGLTAVGYHAGLPADERAAAQHRFMAGDADVVVATNAFGMGVDKADVRTVLHWSIPKSIEALYQEAGRAGRDGRPARARLLAARADLGRLITFIRQGTIEPDAVAGFVRRLGDEARGGELVLDALPDDRDRICLGIAERAGFCALEPARGGRLRVTLRRNGDSQAVREICRAARDRAWRAYRAIEAFAGPDGGCRRRALLDHFGDPRPGAPLGRCCDICDPNTIGLPDPATLSVPRSRGRSGAGAAAPDAVELDPADRALLEALRAWRADAAAGKPAYTVAHNRTLEAIAAGRPASVDALADIRGIGPSFLERHADQVLALVAAS